MTDQTFHYPEIEPQMDADETRIKELEVKEGDSKSLIHGTITEAIIGAAFEVHNHLGYGFLERVYQRAVQAELLKRGHFAEIERRINVRYKDVLVGEYSADLVVDNVVIVEVKVAPQYVPADEAQLINELKATGFEVGILVNFGRSRVQHKRIVCQSAFHPRPSAASRL